MYLLSLYIYLYIHQFRAQGFLKTGNMNNDNGKGEGNMNTGKGKGEGHSPNTPAPGGQHVQLRGNGNGDGNMNNCQDNGDEIGYHLFINDENGDAVCVQLDPTSLVRDFIDHCIERFVCLMDDDEVAEDVSNLVLETTCGRILSHDALIQQVVRSTSRVVLRLRGKGKGKGKKSMGSSKTQTRKGSSKKSMGSSKNIAPYSKGLSRLEQEVPDFLERLFQDGPAS